ncbi:hypothetical protein PRIPAC_85854 [Pristionchus pacificus]|uniref:Uncharacterized protein n=1 Tax=Pristionchus pacificus TaxID=54126 RepID=A0A2A6BH49_PRIPA|nr:hypothetical protein PRIPAC_85854 [Pristionchus pacificus]|eukprot:PDM65141.1 hypothetical protein PRIPAC_53390 [Pristionchus pacificus]
MVMRERTDFSFEDTRIHRDASGQMQTETVRGERSRDANVQIPMEGSEKSNQATFWVYKVGPLGRDSFGNWQYEYAITSNCMKDSVLVLARHPKRFDREYKEEVLEWMKGNDANIQFTITNLRSVECYENVYKFGLFNFECDEKYPMLCSNDLYEDSE